MHINKHFKLWKVVCKNDPCRPQLGRILFSRGHAYATDTHCAVRVPLQELIQTDVEDTEESMQATFAALDGYTCSAHSWKALTLFPKLSLIKSTDEVTLLGSSKNYGIFSVSLTRKSETHYPNIECLFDTDQPGVYNDPLIFDLNLLHKLSEAMSCSKLICHIPGKDLILRMYTNPTAEVNGNHAKGLLVTSRI